MIEPYTNNIKLHLFLLIHSLLAKSIQKPSNLGSTWLTVEPSFDINIYLVHFIYKIITFANILKIHDKIWLRYLWVLILQLKVIDHCTLLCPFSFLPLVALDTFIFCRLFSAEHLLHPTFLATSMVSLFIVLPYVLFAKSACGCCSSSWFTDNSSQSSLVIGALGFASFRSMLCYLAI